MTTKITAAQLYRAADIKDEISSLENELRMMFRRQPKKDAWTSSRRRRFNQTIRQRQALKKVDR